MKHLYYFDADMQEFPGYNIRFLSEDYDEIMDFFVWFFTVMNKKRETFDPKYTFNPELIIGQLLVRCQYIGYMKYQDGPLNIKSMAIRKLEKEFKSRGRFISKEEFSAYVDANSMKFVAMDGDKKLREMGLSRY